MHGLEIQVVVLQGADHCQFVFQWVVGVKHEVLINVSWLPLEDPPPLIFIGFTIREEELVFLHLFSLVNLMFSNYPLDQCAS